MNDCDRRRYEKALPAYEALMKFYPLTVENLDGEIWRPIEGYGAYHVSNFGRVKSLKGNVKILKPQFNTNNYLYVNLCKDGKRNLFLIHRLVALAFIPNPNNKPEVNHQNGHPMNNYVGNLEWVTSSENKQHAFNTGLQKSGAEHHFAKLTNEQVVYIRENPDGLNQYELAEKFGVQQSTISEIQRGKKYRHVVGSIRPKFGVPEEIRDQIRAEYKAGVRGCGAHVLAKKYGVHHQTILKIVHKG